MENLTSKQKTVLLIIGVIVVGMFVFYMTTQTSAYKEINNTETMYVEDNETKEEKSIEEYTEPVKIKVHISGAIEKEGIIELEEGSRINDAIEVAGGLTKEADLTKVNLAYILKDGQKVYIPKISDSKKEEKIISDDNGNGVILDGTESKTNGKVNINTATKDELLTLSGIGTETAEKIIEYRKNNGKFNSIEDLKNVSGIGNLKYENIKDKISVK